MEFVSRVDSVSLRAADDCDVSASRVGVVVNFPLAGVAAFSQCGVLVTDLYNLQDMPPVPFWYGLGFFATLAWTGLLLAVASLQIVQRMVKQSYGAWISWLVVLIVVGLNGVGIYLGRFLRWNSWDIVTDPFAVLQDAITPFLHPLAYRQSVAIIIVFSALLLVVYVSVLSIQQRESSGNPPRE